MTLEGLGLASLLAFILGLICGIMMMKSAVESHEESSAKLGVIVLGEELYKLTKVEK
jgi:hypothetical protein